ncbi:hypothetical protein [Glycomyces tenuis]|uniref:hypothetical protein n=1 Tax=Glycomyces tenuis TaxID=58116 RepID=UPI0003FFF96E|nr:hypothetical protein [Glycomyces tenuis]
MNFISNRVASVVLAVAAILALTACSAVGDALNQPPQTEYTQAEAYAPMEAVAAEAVESLTDFPGFEQRSWGEMPCSHNGIDDPDYTNIEIDYSFSLEVSETDQIREDYVEELREYWTAQGYEITRDEESTYDDRLDRNLVVRTDDGITLWYRVAGYVGLVIQSGCVPVSDLSEIEYVPPIGGIEPGGEGDKLDRYFPDGIPTDQAAAVDPFANTQAGPAPFDSPGSYDNLL